MEDRSAESSSRMLRLQGVRVHNLKDIDVEIPLGKLTVITGVSGSGKSSLAFNTLYAESRRRFLEAFSPALRRRFERLARPEADKIGPLPPAIAFQQQSTTRPRDATIAEATEIADYLQIVFAKCGKVHCPHCRQAITREDSQSILQWIESFPSGTRYQICVPLSHCFQAIASSVGDRDKQSPKKEPVDWSALIAEGFCRIIFKDKTFQLPAASQHLPPALSKLTESDVESASVVIDRLSVGKTSAARCRDSLELALRTGSGRCSVWLATAEHRSDKPGQELMPASLRQTTLDERTWQVREFSTEFACTACGTGIPTITPRDFNRRSPRAACPVCAGSGRIPPQPETTQLDARDVTVRWLKIAETSFDWGPQHETVVWPAGRLTPACDFKVCSECHGGRLSALGRAITLADRGYPEWLSVDVATFEEWWNAWLNSVPGTLLPLVETPASAIAQRLNALRVAGCAGLPLERHISLLSSGETQKVALAGVLGTTLVNTMYVLDEPSAGLSGDDLGPLCETLQSLRDVGNTLVVVDHRQELLSLADHVIEVGPGAGTSGGQIVWSGSPSKFATAVEDPDSTSAVNRKMVDEESLTALASANQELQPTGVCTLVFDDLETNTQPFEISLPIGALTVLCGPSGVGKTTLACRLLPQLLMAGRQRSVADSHQSPLGRSVEYELADSEAAGVLASRYRVVSRLQPAQSVTNVVVAARAAIGRNQRSNPATYLNLFDEIRKVFAATADAGRRGLTAKHFSFNSKSGGRCARCQGLGQVTVPLQFLPDVEVECPECQGTRYEPGILQVKSRDRSIADVLAMTAREAAVFFRSHRKLQSKLTILSDVGLDYLCLGQPLNTLSGGEGQRLQLASAMMSRLSGPTLFILDQPTVGLHNRDVRKLLDCFHGLIATGHTVLAIDDHQTLLDAATKVIRLQPG